MKILLIEDEIKTLQSLKMGLEENGMEVDTASEGNLGLNLALNQQYSVVVTDIILPGLNGLEICSSLRAKNIHTPVLMLTALDSTREKLAGFDSGTDDYLVKPFAFAELLARIKALSKRNSGNHASILTIDNLVLDLEARTVMRNNIYVDMTSREYDLLTYFIQNKNKVLSKKAIAENVWKINFDTGTNTIEVYVNYLRNKIDKGADVKLIHTVHGQGYMLKEPQHADQN